MEERGWSECEYEVFRRNIKAEHVDWIHMIQDKGQQRVLVNMVMELRIPKKEKGFLSTSETTASTKKKLFCFT
jgi:hypothetical protein